MLAERFVAENADLRGLSLHESDETLVIGYGNEETSISVFRRDDDWEVLTDQAHEHFEDLTEALHLAANLARGELRTCQEFRDDTLAASWIEYPDGDSFVRGGPAIYLSPFDRDEWEPRPGETWRQVRTVRMPWESGVLGLDSYEVTGVEPNHPNSELLDWFAIGLGEPQEGMKWTSTFNLELITQAPVGWRCSARSDDPPGPDFAPVEGNLILRLSSFYRDAVIKHAKRTTSAAKPVSIQYERLEDVDEWTQDRWTLMFGDGDQDVMAWITLYCHESTPEQREPMRGQIDSSVDKTIYVPVGEWDWRTVD
jgi:hypothetical protein